MLTRLLLCLLLVWSFDLFTTEQATAQIFGRRRGKEADIEKLIQPKIPAKPAEKVDLQKTVVLRASQRTPDAKYYGGMIVRELFRQGFLIAARDEMSLATRDMALKESGGETALSQNRLLDVRCYPQIGKSLRIEVRRLSKDKTRQFLLQTKNSMPPIIKPKSELIDIQPLLDIAESYSRGEFIAALKKSGYSGKQIKTSANLQVPKEINLALNKMTFTSQFSAVRQLHHLMRQQGQSQFVIGALARGYANLGVLTERLWSPAHKIFKARALLYAQRLVVAEKKSGKKSAWARWHRGYVFALCGYHSWAEKDFQQANRWYQLQLAKNQLKKETLVLKKPTWVALIDKFYRFNLSEINPRKLQYGENQELAFLLRTLAIEYPTANSFVNYAGPGESSNAIPHSVFLEQESMRRMLPHCMRLHEAYCQFHPLFFDKEAITLPLKIFSDSLYEEMAKQKGLSNSIKNIIKQRSTEKTDGEIEFNEYDYRATLIQTLHNTTRTGADPQELTWDVLANLIQEVSFVQVWRQANSIRINESERYGETRYPVKFLNKTAKLLAEHPMLPYLQSIANDRGKDRDKIRVKIKKFIQSLDRTSILREHGQVYSTLSWLDERDSDSILHVAFRNEDRNYRGLAFRVLKGRSRNLSNIALNLKILSPHSPLTATLLVKYHWKTERKNGPFWVKRFAKNVELLNLISAHYMQEKRFVEARSVIKMMVKIKPTWRSYQRMANSYRQQGNIKKWISTITEYLARDMTEDQRHDARLQLARYYLQQNDFKKALAYAKDAMKKDDRSELNYDYQTISIAVECLEYLRDWASAEKMFKTAVNESYSSDESWMLHWYFLTQRSGQGDIAEARRTAKRYIATVENQKFHPLDTDDEGSKRELENHALHNAQAAIYYILEQQPEKSVAKLKRSLGIRVNPYESLHLALIALEMNDLKLFNTTLEDCEKQGTKFTMLNRSRIEMVQLAKLLRIATANKKNRGKLDLEIINKIIEKAPRGEQNNLYYFVARYLELNKNNKSAVRYYRLCIQQPVLKMNRTLACVMMRQMGYEPTDIHCVIKPKTTEPKNSQAKK